MIIALDFDGVLHDQNPDPGRRMGRPIDGAREAVIKLKNEGWNIIIYSNRIKGHEDLPHIQNWLTYFSIPFDQVSITKPRADIYLDDKALKFVNWQKALHDIDNA